jgi:protein-L-isoaspartate(D-aspartate) O-methyltransferase
MATQQDHPRAVDPQTRSLPSVEQCRRFYAQEIRAVAGLDSHALVAAFARVSRESFLGPPPWLIGSGTSLRPAAYRATSDVRDLYHDVFVALKGEKSLNNGQPGMIARLLAALDLWEGMRVLHMGCGTGYYTAILAEVVGLDGAVTAVEVDPDLAAQAKTNLARYPNVQVLNQDGATLEPSPCDAILINAGVTHPHPAWLTSLTQSGVLVLPLAVGRTPASADALVVRIHRCGNRFAAEPVTVLTIFPSTSLRDPARQFQLNAAFESHRILAVHSVRAEAHEPCQTCIVHTPGFCLCAEVPGSRKPPESSRPG